MEREEELAWLTYQRDAGRDGVGWAGNCLSEASTNGSNGSEFGNPSQRLPNCQPLHTNGPATDKIDVQDEEMV